MEPNDVGSNPIRNHEFASVVEQQTRQSQKLVSQGVQVQLLPEAPDQCPSGGMADTVSLDLTA